MPTEADTCRTLITPKLQAAGWESDPHSIAEQRFFTDGRIVVHGNKATRRKGKRADYLLRYTRDFPIAVVEAKPEHEPAATGLQQAKDYAEILGLKFAYTTNGREAIEFDYLTGLERVIPQFPSPAELWSRLRAAENLADDTTAPCLLTPANLTTGKEPRYYQRIAIASAVQSILQGKRRVLLTMATGTGKTVVQRHVVRRWRVRAHQGRTAEGIQPAHHRPAESIRRRVAGERLQPRSQAPARQGRHHAPSARTTRRQYPEKGTTHRGNHGPHPQPPREAWRLTDLDSRGLM
jgi:hypothetical protein